MKKIWGVAAVLMTLYGLFLTGFAVVLVRDLFRRFGNDIALEILVTIWSATLILWFGLKCAARAGWFDT